MDPTAYVVGLCPSLLAKAEPKLIDLPDELLLGIFAYLDVPELLAMSRVSSGTASLCVVLR